MKKRSKESYSEEFLEHIRQPVDDVKEKFYPRSFSVKLPMKYGELMMKLPTKERTKLLRRGAMQELDQLNNQDD